MDLILAIAALCQVNSGSSTASSISAEQASCHKYYAECYEEHTKDNSIKAILICAKERK